MKSNLVKHFMTASPIFLQSDDSIEEVAKEMERVDAGIFPVGSVNHVQGIVTDRDIVVRALAKDKSPKITKVGEIMTKTVQAILEDATVAEAAAAMRRNQVSRLLVKNTDGQVTGILSLGHLVRNADAQVLEEIIERTASKRKAA